MKVRYDEFDTQRLPHMRIRDGNSWMYYELVRMLYEQSAAHVAGTMFAAVALVGLLYDSVSPPLLVGWLGAVGLSCIIRIIARRRFYNDVNAVDNARQWGQLSLRLLFLTGILWALVSLLMFPVEVASQVYVAFVMAALLAGSVTATSPLRGAFGLLSIPMSLAYIGQLLIAGTHESLLLAATFFILLFATTHSTRYNRLSVISLLKSQVKNADLSRALHHRATHDSLVDLYNHGEFQKRLARMRFETEPYSVVFIDLDTFKEINDAGGHATGDSVLMKVAGVLKSHTRQDDTVARVGGDEFALLLPGCPRERAGAVAERVRQDIEALKFEVSGRVVRVGASIGVAHTSAHLTDPMDVLRKADQACYLAKQSGRNQVHVPSADVTGEFRYAGANG